VKIKIGGTTKNEGSLVNGWRHWIWAKIRLCGCCHNKNYACFGRQILMGLSKVVIGLGCHQKMKGVGKKKPTAC